ncbi:alpha/beta hydrolase [Streptomyces sp. NPDC001165]|uniref:alpha/beta hydrolase n=1 Tax=Streptomyces sp. NPDC001165 TaxID=3364546 RepID=UPI0036B4244D
MWRDHARHLAARGTRVIRYGQRGHGASLTGTSPAFTRLLADDLAAVLRHTHHRSGIVVTGHSMGGMGVLQLAAHHPAVAASLSGVLLVATSDPRSPIDAATNWYRAVTGHHIEPVSPPCPPSPSTSWRENTTASFRPSTPCAWLRNFRTPSPGPRWPPWPAHRAADPGPRRARQAVRTLADPAAPAPAQRLAARPAGAARRNPERRTGAGNPCARLPGTRPPRPHCSSQAVPRLGR